MLSRDHSRIVRDQLATLQNTATYQRMNDHYTYEQLQQISISIMTVWREIVPLAEVEKHMEAVRTRNPLLPIEHFDKADILSRFQGALRGLGETCVENIGRPGFMLSEMEPITTTIKGYSILLAGLCALAGIEPTGEDEQELTATLELEDPCSEQDS